MKENSNRNLQDQKTGASDEEDLTLTVEADADEEPLELTEEVPKLSENADQEDLIELTEEINPASFDNDGEEPIELTEKVDSPSSETRENEIRAEEIIGLEEVAEAFGKQELSGTEKKAVSVNVSEESIDKALEKVIRSIFAEKIERILVDTVKKVVAEDIEKLKKQILQNGGDEPTGSG